MKLLLLLIAPVGQLDVSVASLLTLGSCGLRMNLSKVIDEIYSLEDFGTFVCAECDTSVRCHVLQIYAVCPKVW